MSPDEQTPDPPPLAEGRSDFLAGQMRQWMEEVVAAGKTADLFELEMWLRSFERFFRVKNQPLSERETRQLTLRNWSEELRLVDNVMVRVTQLCTAILSEEHVNKSRFNDYIESYLKKDEGVDPYIGKLMRQATPEASLVLLRECLDDIHLLLADLVKHARLSYATFQAVGKVIYREIRRSHLLALLIDKKFKPIYDRITNPAIIATMHRIEDPGRRKQAAKVFLEYFRLLHYLEYAQPTLEDEDLKSTILVFSLIISETRLLLSFLEKRVLRGADMEDPVYQLYDSFVYCVPLELKKVVNTELMDISVSRQTDNVRARVENSHGILKDCFQQSVVQLAQTFDPQISGQAIFPDFMAKREQSVRLRDSLGALVDVVRQFQDRRDEAAAVLLKARVSEFYDHTLKYLMYRDWSGFELFFIEILKCPSLMGLQQISHRFETFLTTLYREVQKRAILQEPTPGPEPAGAGPA